MPKAKPGDGGKKSGPPAKRPRSLKKYPCPYCKELFFTVQQLYQHCLGKHVGTYYYLCKTCLVSRKKRDKASFFRRDKHACCTDGPHDFELKEHKVRREAIIQSLCLLYGYEPAVFRDPEEMGGPSELSTPEQPTGGPAPGTTWTWSSDDEDGE